ncbi:hypothetical protein M8J77_001764 [Diaphorina citri]|nr:hypothetical protein M8J77_001764 [Diaphorina citri]
MVESAKDHDASIILVSEPNIIKTRQGGWFVNDICNTAIKIMKPDLIKTTSWTSGSCYVRVDTETTSYYSCYLSPNDRIEVFKRKLGEIEDSIREINSKEIIITGDFNSKAYAWCSPVEDTRGIILAEWFASLDIVILNKGSTPTFIRENTSSFLDITASSQGIVRKIIRWEVLTEENLSDHNTILFEINNATQQQIQSQQTSTNLKIWKFQEEKRNILKNKISETIQTIDKTPEDLTNLLQNICEEIFPRRVPNNRRKPVYWWNQEISELRKKCFAFRRKLVRGNRSGNEEDKDRRRREYYNSKKDLRRSIRKSQTEAWKKLCQDLNDNVWGNGYKIVCKKLKLNNNKQMSTAEKLREADKLFPQQNVEEWELEQTQEDEIPLFSLDELLNVCIATKNKKAPGPDGIVPEITKELILTAPSFCLELYNNLLKKGLFPNTWKKAKLVLIEKPKKSADTETSFRPICLLDGLSKVYERLIKKRLEDEIETNGGLSPQQFGFRSGKSTIDAMLEVKNIANRAKNQNKLCVMTLADVKNAFGSVPWRGILEELKKRNISNYLMNIIASYFTDRKIMIDDSTYPMTCGAPQGSVLGALMWNVYYDPVLREKMPPNTTAIAYADDLILLTTGREKSTIELEINLAMLIVNKWMKSKQLQLAPQKTEVVMLVSSRAVPQITIEVDRAGAEVHFFYLIRYKIFFLWI